MKNKFYLNDFSEYIGRNSIYTNLTIILSFLFSALVILFFNYFIDAFFSFNTENFRVGQPAKQDYTLKTDMFYYNDLETKLAQEVEEKLVLPVFRIDNRLSSESLSNFKTFYETILPLVIDRDKETILIETINRWMPDVFTVYEIRGFYQLDIRLLYSLVYNDLKNILTRGYIDSDDVRLSNGSGLISVISLDEDNLDSEVISAVSVLSSLYYNSDIDSNLIKYYRGLVDHFVTVNCFYDREQTEHNLKLAVESVEPVVDYYRSGETLVRKDFIVSSRVFDMIESAEGYLKKDIISNTMLVFGFLFLVYIAGFVLFTQSFVHKTLKESDVVLIASVTLFFVVSSVLVRYFLSVNFSFLYPLVIPSILLTMLMTFLLGNRVGLYLSVLYSFIILLISDFSIYAFSVTLIITILSNIIVHDVEKRIDLIKASGELALLQALLVVFMIAVDIISSVDMILIILVSIVSSLISGSLTLALLPLSEHILKISTSFQLAELCDLNAPLLKSLLVKAPGTYAHSIAVANMAESAAEHIGANALLAKAGGYYHDIGKIDQPHYFIENQKGGKNLHDDMKPSLSVAVIKSHVKLGIEKAKNIGLPREVIDIIEQHHGKGAIAYFLDKAKKESKGTVVLTEDFGYSGPNPDSPEAAIVMLADSVEAAVRSLKNPTISQLEKFVWDLILNKLKEGMLDACGLTLSDLTEIKNSFIKTLMGHYHSRIEYPTEGEE